jgi:hypothetical protein
MDACGNLTLGQQFNLKHGDDGIIIKGYVYFSDGATREANSYGLLSDPPYNSEERCKLILYYWEERLRRAIAFFDEQKGNLVSQARGNLHEEVCTPPPPCDTEWAVQQLKKVQDAVKEVQKKRDEARMNLEKVTPKWKIERAIQAQANKEKNQQFLAAVISIEV